MENERKSYEKLNKILLIENVKIAIHIPSLNIIPEEFIELKYLLEAFQIKQKTIDSTKHMLEENFTENINNFDKNVDTLFNKHINKPLYLVAAGPPLDKNIQELAKVKDNGIILSVGRAVKSLLSAGITPDYIIITDLSEYLYDMQLKGLDIDVPIVVLSTCDKNVMKKYKGFKYIAL
ncbi:6-hydroxymethylpterin diphosphokinase MptE-like protein [Tissierella sp. P1]|uniref:6-hydroxymethylpterin diphosphokinase MptE-like protein n=1 Tax=Tissierella sp. P1 TaxID=1280483 RepID=UPI0013032CC7|nr:6-hydroxymethylpterin diphosphokinase MptE-like protein [Tissierella sp. P1]